MFLSEVIPQIFDWVELWAASGCTLAATAVAITTCNVLRALFAQYGVGICETRHGKLAIGTFTGV
ncbi:MAG: hypothetical protein H0W78_12320 [Planctomycetes bacterium]|uniref:hypothetical protein n=1 Tax=Methylibium sp. TaxID=2067992 RepID=UPI001806047F|nr:hypothetical protein [Methylibium sp.]MBA3590680.1 hypothetical protein [Methylibium sp.]MBA3699623.1 hypothetical protein [Planctomycetota bacterium]